MFKIICCCILLANTFNICAAQEEFTSEYFLMGSKITFTVICNNKSQAEEAFSLAKNEVSRIELLISSWIETSETNLINTNAGINPVRVSKELFDLIKRSNNVSNITQGAFDLSFGSIAKDLWHFNSNMTELPDSLTALKAVEKINYKNIILNEKESTVYLKEKGMRLGFGAIGKGYAAEKVKQLLISNGIKSGIVNVGGDLAVWGKQANGEDWTIGIANPNLKQEAFSYLKISNTSVVTSGNYEKYAIINGIKYSHIINPKTGMPVSGTKSVTIICNNAELADALSTAVYVMGPITGMDLIEQLNAVECLIIDENDKIHSSSNVKLR